MPRFRELGNAEVLRSENSEHEMIQAIEIRKSNLPEMETSPPRRGDEANIVRT